MPGSGFWGSSKPPHGSVIDPNHWLSRGQILALAATEGNGSMLRDFSLGQGVGALSAAGVKWVGGKSGAALNFDSSGSGIVTGASPFGGLVNATWASRVLVRSTTTSNGAWWTGNTAFNGSFLFGRNGTTGSGASCGQFLIGSSGGWPFQLTLDAWQDVVLVDNAGTATMYVNGAPVLINGNPTQGGFAAVPAHTGYQLGKNTVHSWPIDGMVEFAYGWNRAFAPVEVEEFYGAPYQNFAPPVWRRYFIGGAPAFDSSVVPWAAQSLPTPGIAVAAF